MNYLRRSDLEGKDVYQLAKFLYDDESEKKSLESYLIGSIQLMIKHKNDDEKLKYFGEDAYIDYKIYQKNFDEKNHGPFTRELTSLIEDSNFLTPNQKNEIVEGFLEKLDGETYELFREWVIAKKIQEEYFSTDSFKNYLDVPQ